ncbi:MAG: HupE/UreJ family protein [Pseudomonadota bacterium]
MVALWVAFPLSAVAHQAALAVLTVTEIQENRYTLEWENKPTASEGDDFLAFSPIWPEGCVEDAQLLICDRYGLSGEIGFEGLGAAQSAAMIRITPLAGEARAVLLTPTTPTARLISAADAATWEGRLSIARNYTALGVEHIVVGIDHLMFVLGLMLIATTRWMLVKTITAFTIAHTVTLTAVSFGWVGVPEAFVNTMIALSIVFVAVEIMRHRHGQSSITLRNPEIVSFGFGLLHGFGFANALVSLGLPEGARVLALAAFNIGVEIGQLLFVVLALALIWSWRSMSAPMVARPAQTAAYVIGGVASYWFIDRLVALTGGIA